YITEGQIVLDRELHARGIYPPISVLPSLSRLMKDNIGSEKTRDDHPSLASQLFASYARTRDIKAIASIIGEEELSSLDRLYLKFGELFETKFINQAYNERRTLNQSLELGWDIISNLPEDQLVRISQQQIKLRYRNKK
ncbi:MAG: V-type ATP synthase subunit B, partial [Candidatus Omnitrophica bacterium]|nr:V-type ATP synthase subunit B [Candidatus Omnitrophota bacterium]